MPATRQRTTLPHVLSPGITLRLDPDQVARLDRAVELTYSSRQGVIRLLLDRHLAAYVRDLERLSGVHSPAPADVGSLELAAIGVAEPQT